MKSILLADDSVTIQKVVELTFMDGDYQVVAVNDGTQAVAKLQEAGGSIDLVIADVHMPGDNGYEVCRKAKAMHPSLPVLLLVGTFEPFDEGEAKAAAADGYLKKPFDSQELLQRVESLLSASSAPAPPAPPAAEAFAAPQPPPVEMGVPDPAPAPSLPEPTAIEFATAPAPEPPAPEPPAPAHMEPPPVAAPEPVAPEVAAAPEVPAVESAPEPVTQPAPEPAAPEPAAPAPAAPEPAPTPHPAETVAVTQPVTEAQPSAAETRPTRAQQPDSASDNGSLSNADVERIARKVIELVGADAVKDVAWEVVPDLAEVVIRERISELESQVE